MAYMDDIYLIGPMDRITNALEFLTTEFGKISLKINLTKCSSTVELPQPWNVIKKTDNFKILGSPLSVAEDTGGLDNKTHQLIEEISKLNDAQISLHLLRYVHNSSLTHSMRTSSPAANESAIKAMEDETLVALSEIIGVTRSDMEKVKTRVHYDTGPGLGFKDLAADAEDAYCASWLESFQRL